MSPVERRHLYLPARDRSFWRAETAASPLLYLAWGSRDFHREPVPASRHEGWVCVLVEEGAPFMVIRKRAVRMPSGTLVLIGPDCPFGWRGSASGQSRFRLWMWRTVAASWPAAPLSSTFVSRQLARHERPPFLQLHDLCRREVLRGSDADATYLEGCRLLFDTMIRRAWRDDEARAGETVDLVSLARAWMMAHLDSREPVARLCDYLDVSQSTLYRVFTAAEGTSPLAWFHRARMEEARARLANGAVSVKEVAHALGYDHASDLSRAYRRYFGAPATGAARRRRSGVPA